MAVHLDHGIAEHCKSACDIFVSDVLSLSRGHKSGDFSSAHGSFDTARQIGAVYSLFAGEDLRTLLNGYIDQAKAMSMLFAAAGGLIEAQDEAVAALGKAAQEPAGLQSLSLMSSLGSTTALLDAADGTNALGSYGRVGPEDVSGSPLERIAEGARALDPDQFADVQARMTEVSGALSTAATGLKSDLDAVLGSSWQGDFASHAQDSVTGLVNSAIELAGQLEVVADKAGEAHQGFTTTRERVGSEAAAVEAVKLRTPGLGPIAGPVSPAVTADAEAARLAAEEQARAIVNTEYSPAVMDANLDGLDFTTAYRVVSTSAIGGPTGLDLARIWNTDAIPRPASPAEPSEAAIAAATGYATGTGAEGTSAGEGVGNRTTTTSPPPAATDATTDQALLASRAGAADASGTVSATAGQTGAGAGTGGVNAATTAAGAPFAPATTSGQQSGSGAGAGGIRGNRGGGAGRDRDRDRGFGPAAGLVGGGRAAAAGAGASRMGGAGTLAGLGSAAGPGGSGPATGAPGGGSANAGAAGSGPGAFSSSSTGGAQAGRPGAMPMGGMMGAASTGHNRDRRGHTPAGYLTNATNTSAIIGDPVKVAPAVLGRRPPVDESEVDATKDAAAPDLGRVIGRDYTGNGARRR